VAKHVAGYLGVLLLLRSETLLIAGLTVLALRRSSTRALFDDVALINCLLVVAVWGVSDQNWAQVHLGKHTQLGVSVLVTGDGILKLGVILLNRDGLATLGSIAVVRVGLVVDKLSRHDGEEFVDGDLLVSELYERVNWVQIMFLKASKPQ
jgi:hypothetical protein